MDRAKEAPFFSVITPSWNQGTFLSSCVESVLAQADPSFEHFVFDNCSDDATPAVAARYSHLRYFSEQDRGQSHAVNKGLDAARGEIICWLNADDAYAPGLFSRLREIFSDAACDIVFGDTEQIAYDGTKPQRAGACFRDRLDLVKWWTSEVRMHQPAVFFRRRVASETGFLREDLHYAMDYEYWWRASETFTFHYVPEILAIQHRQPDSKTMRCWHKVYEERENIFAPFYPLVDGDDRRALLRDKRRELARRYLTNAFVAAPLDLTAALQNLARAWGQAPAEVLKLRNLGLLRRILKRPLAP